MIKKNNASGSTACPICGHRPTMPFLQRKQQPFSIFLMENDTIPEVDLRLNHCEQCSAVFVASVMEDSDYQGYCRRNNQTYTLLDGAVRPFPSKDDYYTGALDFLMKFHNVVDDRYALEVGSNRGDFLYLLKQKHPRLNVVGVEPTKLPFHGVPTVNRHFKASLFGSTFDLIIVRHVLEHIVAPLSFMEQIQTSLTDDGTVFLEVPNFGMDLKQQRETFIPEHLHFFTIESLASLLAKAGLSVGAYDDRQANGIYVLANKRGSNHSGRKMRSGHHSDLEELLGDYVTGMKATMEYVASLLSDGYGLAFYGFGNIFLSAYAHIRNCIGMSDHSGQFVILDDTPGKIGRSFNNIPVKAIDFLTTCPTEKWAVMICTMNRQHHKTMEKRVREMTGVDSIILSPWSAPMN